MRKITNQTVFELSHAFEGYNTIDIGMPFKLSYAKSKHEKEIYRHATEYEIFRKKLNKEAAIVDEKTKEPIMVNGQFQIDPAKKADFDAKMKALLEEEVEVIDYKIQLSDAEAALIPPAAIPFLSTFIDFLVE